LPDLSTPEQVLFRLQKKLDNRLFAVDKKASKAIVEKRFMAKPISTTIKESTTTF